MATPRDAHCAPRRCPTAASAAGGEAAAAIIKVKVKNSRPSQGSEVLYSINETAPLRKLMLAYCNHLDLPFSQVLFSVDEVAEEAPAQPKLPQFTVA